ncbi:endospore germination permease [Paenibacillus sp. R14(2021)]|uniref:GerAB/ArcD/ProY family transporter n=1 Tax=Paenibacillus sp. R14(2021) TaxID=2859228 RepID=UPI001C616765|nr:endospore germination permease [Paenibacillus sp. R14(2021)]
MKQAKLDRWQLFTLTLSFCIGTTFILLPSDTIASGKQDAWLLELWSCLYGVILACLWLYLYKFHPGLSLIEIALKLLGKWVGGFVSVLYIVFFLQISSWVTRNMSDYMSSNIMPKTPISIFNIMVLFVCAYAVVKGIESISSVSGMLTPSMMLIFWIPFTLMLKEWRWSRFDLPQVDLGHVFLHTTYLLGFPYMETISLLMLFPYAQRDKLRKPFLLGISSSGVLMSIALLFTVGILGVYRSEHLSNPIYIIFREMQFSNFIEHLEAIISVNVLVMVFIKLSVIFYCAVLGICQLLGLQNRAIVAYPLIWVISAYAMYFDNVIDNFEWVRKYLFDYYSLFAIIIPVLLIAVTWLKQSHLSYKGEEMS